MCRCETLSKSCNSQSDTDIKHIHTAPKNNHKIECYTRREYECTTWAEFMLSKVYNFNICLIFSCSFSLSLSLILSISFSYIGQIVNVHFMSVVCVRMYVSIVIVVVQLIGLCLLPFCTSVQWEWRNNKTAITNELVSFETSTRPVNVL